jgi:hypothetical protein
MKNVISNDGLITEAILMNLTYNNHGFEIRLLTVSRRHLSPLTQRTPIGSVVTPKETLNKLKLRKYKRREQDR